MNVKKISLATVAAAVAMWLLAGLWHMVIVPGFYATHGEAAHHEGGGLIIVAYVMLAALMAFVYPIGYKGGHPVLEGLRFGALIGFLWVTPHALVRAGAHSHEQSIRYTYLVVNGVWHLIEQGAGGIVVGLIFGRRPAAAADGSAPTS